MLGDFVAVDDRIVDRPKEPPAPSSSDAGRLRSQMSHVVSFASTIALILADDGNVPSITTLVAGTSFMWAGIGLPHRGDGIAAGVVSTISSAWQCVGRSTAHRRRGVEQCRKLHQSPAIDRPRCRLLTEKRAMQSSEWV